MPLAGPRPGPTPRGSTRAGIALGLLILGLGSHAWADDAAELARLRQELAEKDRVIQQLTRELAVKSGEEPVPVIDKKAEIASVLAEPEVSPPPSPPSFALPKQDNLTDLFDNFSLFAGLDGSKQPQDFGVNALFGGRFHFDWGVPIIRDRGLGLQVGSAINFSPDAVQVFDRIQGTKQRLQNFTTVGLYQRTDWGLNWGLGYDFLYEQYFDHFHLGQWRGRLGYEWNPRNEVGANLMLRSYGSNGNFGKTPVSLQPIDMASLFYRHTFDRGPSLTVWAGMADQHNEANAALGDAGVVHHPFLYGAQIDAPLNDHFAIFGQANFITPPATGTVDAFLGIVYHPVSLAQRERSKRLRPVMAIANNPTFAVDLGRRR